jgi:hypothetical protein
MTAVMGVRISTAAIAVCVLAFACGTEDPCPRGGCTVGSADARSDAGAPDGPATDGSARDAEAGDRGTTPEDGSAVDAVVEDAGPSRAMAWNRQGQSTTDYRGLAGGPTAIVVVGDEIATSADGVSWVSRATAAPLSAVVYAEGAFVAVGQAGTIVRSTDGLAWSPVTSSTTHPLHDVGYAAGRFVAVGGLDTGRILISDDGMSWREAVVAGGVSRDWRLVFSIFPANDRFFAATVSASAYGSADGLTWLALSVPAGLHDAVFGANVYVASGNLGLVMTSPDGTRWTTEDSDTSATLSALAFGGGRFVAAGSFGTLLASEDGTSWSAASAPPQPTHLPSSVALHLEGVTFWRGRFYAVGNGGTILRSDEP